MKIKNITALCKKTKTLVLTKPDENGLQYAGDGAALFLLEGITDINLNTLMRVFDISPEDSEEWKTLYEEFPQAYDISECAEECEAYTGIIRKIETLSGSICPLFFTDRAIFIKEEYMKKCRDEETRLFVRKATNGMLYIAVKKGISVNGIILPVDVMKDSENMTNMKKAIENIAEREAELTPKGPIKDNSGRVVFSE